MTPPRIPDAGALEEHLARPRFLLFKHSPVCPVSARALAEYEAFLGTAPDVDTGWIDVIGQRDLSQKVAADAGVRHESPQAILFAGGRTVWNASHGAITRRSLADAIAGAGA